MGTNLLNMTENEFWRCTPKKLFALWDIYKETKGINNKEENEGFIDDIMF